MEFRSARCKKDPVEIALLYISHPSLEVFSNVACDFRLSLYTNPNPVYSSLQVFLRMRYTDMGGQLGLR
jgi:hypothetical protein